MKALILGATGAVGKPLVQLLLADARFSEVVIFVRRDAGLQHEKLTQHIVDFEQPAAWSELVCGDVLFSCLGTTLKAAGSQAAQWRIDHDYQLHAAQAAAKNGVARYVLVSSANANAASRLFYSRMKGVLEDEVRALPFSQIIVARPPLLDRPESDRWAERTGVSVLRFLTDLGLFPKLRPMPVATLALALRNALFLPASSPQFLEPPSLWETAQRT